MPFVSKSLSTPFNVAWPPTPANLCDLITENAFDFLGSAVEEFKDKPKYSVIHFCTGIELLLKARLMKEHWSLIVRDANKAAWDDFISGKCVTVNLDESFTRLANMAQNKQEKDFFEELSKENKNKGRDKLHAFNRLAEHRNQILHFYHQLIQSNEQMTTSIAREQCQGWYAIKKLLTVQWKEHFPNIQPQIDTLDAKMRKHREYLKVIYENDFKPSIEEEIASGQVYEVCPSCENHSAKVNTLLEEPTLQRDTCRVCGYDSYPYLRFSCDICEQSVIFQDEEGYCDNCEKEYDVEDLKNKLSDSHDGMSTSDMAMTDWEFNCSWCDGYHTAVHHKECFICLQCLEHADSIEYCGWCGEGCLGLSNGPDNESFYLGCSACDGHAGWHAGKDD